MIVKIENKHMARYFKLEDGKFYTSHLLNKKLDEPIGNEKNTEFVVSFCDGSQLSSEDFTAHVVEQTNETLLVSFYHSEIQLTILYSGREDVLAKEVTILSSSKTINYMDAEQFGFANLEQVYIPKQQEDIKEMAGFSGYYVELGQPIYAKSFFFGMEFPMGETDW